MDNKAVFINGKEFSNSEVITLKIALESFRAKFHKLFKDSVAMQRDHLRNIDRIRANNFIHELTLEERTTLWTALETFRLHVEGSAEKMNPILVEGYRTHITNMQEKGFFY